MASLNNKISLEATLPKHNFSTGTLPKWTSSSENNLSSNSAENSAKRKANIAKGASAAMGIASAGLTGITGSIKLDNSKISEIKSDIDRVGNTNFSTGSTADLINRWSSLGDYGHYTWLDVRGLNKKLAATNIFGSTVSGATAGLSAGPWGALAGAAVGAGAGLAGVLLGKRKAKREVEYLNNLAESVKRGAFNDMSSNAYNILTNTMRNANTKWTGALGGFMGSDSAIGYLMASDYIGNYSKKVLNENSMKLIPNSFTNNSNVGLLNGGDIFAFGGNAQTNGADFSTGMSHINAGGTHEENPNEGVPMGVDLNGTPNLVEEGETIYDNYVFSDRLKIERLTAKKGELLTIELRILNKYAGKSYAQATKRAEHDSGIDERPNDPIAIRGFLAVLGVLAFSQEKQREQEKLKELQELIKNMSPEELQLFKEMFALAILQGMQELTQPQQQLMPQLSLEQMLQLYVQSLSPEEQLLLLQYIQQMPPELRELFLAQLAQQVSTQLQLTSPEDLQMMQLQMMAQLGQMSPEELLAMMQLQQMALRGLMSPEEQQAMQQLMMMLQLGLPMGAFGGRLYSRPRRFAEGGELSPEEQQMMMAQQLQQMSPEEQAMMQLLAELLMAQQLMPQEEMMAQPQLEVPEEEEMQNPEELQKSSVDEMSTKELNQAIDEIMLYAKQTKNKEMLKAARKAKRGSREDKEDFVEDAMDEILIEEENAAQQELEAQRVLEQLLAELLNMLAAQLVPLLAQNVLEQSPIMDPLLSQQLTATPADAGNELDSQLELLGAIYADGGLMDIKDQVTLLDLFMQYLDLLDNSDYKQIAQKYILLRLNGDIEGALNFGLPILQQFAKQQNLEALSNSQSSLWGTVPSGVNNSFALGGSPSNKFGNGGATTEGFNNWLDNIKLYYAAQVEKRVSELDNNDLWNIRRSIQKAFLPGAPFRDLPKDASDAIIYNEILKLYRLYGTINDPKDPHYLTSKKMFGNKPDYSLYNIKGVLKEAGNDNIYTEPVELKNSKGTAVPFNEWLLSLGIYKDAYGDIPVDYNALYKLITGKQDYIGSGKLAKKDLKRLYEAGVGLAFFNIMLDLNNGYLIAEGKPFISASDKLEYTRKYLRELRTRNINPDNLGESGQELVLRDLERVLEDPTLLQKILDLPSLNFSSKKRNPLDRTAAFDLYARTKNRLDKIITELGGVEVELTNDGKIKRSYKVPGGSTHLSDISFGNETISYDQKSGKYKIGNDEYTFNDLRDKSKLYNTDNWEIEKVDSPFIDELELRKYHYKRFIDFVASLGDGVKLSDGKGNWVSLLTYLGLSDEDMRDTEGKILPRLAEISKQKGKIARDDYYFPGYLTAELTDKYYRELELGNEKDRDLARRGRNMWAYMANDLLRTPINYTTAKFPWLKNLTLDQLIHGTDGDKRDLIRETPAYLEAFRDNPYLMDDYNGLQHGPEWDLDYGFKRYILVDKDGNPVKNDDGSYKYIRDWANNKDTYIGYSDYNNGTRLFTDKVGDLTRQFYGVRAPDAEDMFIVEGDKTYRISRTDNLEKGKNNDSSLEDLISGASGTSSWFKLPDDPEDIDEDNPKYPLPDLVPYDIAMGLTGLGFGLSALSDLTRDPYRDLGNIKPYFIGVDPIRTPKEQLRKSAYYRTLPLYAQYNAMNNAILNQSNGSSTAGIGNLIASGYARLKAINDAYNLTTTENNQMLLTDQALISDVLSKNMLADLEAQKANQAMAIQALQPGFDARLKLIEALKQREDDKSKELGQYLTNMANLEYLKSRDKYAAEQTKWAADRRVFGQGAETVEVPGTTKKKEDGTASKLKAKGGKLLRRRYKGLSI